MTATTERAPRVSSALATALMLLTISDPSRWTFGEPAATPPLTQV
ncbi:hypothetical protein AB0M45_03180 [Nocardia sp. NPDC051787]